MDFANERYVRLYVRETTTWLRLGWEGQAILPQVLRFVDRSGVLDVEDLEPGEAIHLRMPHWPREIVSAGVARMIELGIIEHRGDSIVWPKYLEAQETAQSDAQRAREARARRRDTKRDPSVTNSDASITNCDENVTRGHAASHAVTPSVPYRAVPSVPSVQERALFERVWLKFPKRAGGNPQGPAFEAWRARLREGVSAEALESAVERYAAFCNATGKIGTETVQQTATFFGPKKRGFEEAWEIPRSPNGQQGHASRPPADTDWDAEARRAHASQRNE